MALKIRLARGGAKKRPFYRVVVAESRSPRDGRFVEKVGTYNPLLPQGHTDRVVLNIDRIKHWLSVGAQATERVDLFLTTVGLSEKKERRDDPKKSALKKKAQERLKAAKEAEAAAAQKAAEVAVKIEEPTPQESPAITAAEPPAPAESTTGVLEQPEQETSSPEQAQEPSVS